MRPTDVFMLLRALTSISSPAVSLLGHSNQNADETAEAEHRERACNLGAHDALACSPERIANRRLKVTPSTPCAAARSITLSQYSTGIELRAFMVRT